MRPLASVSAGLDFAFRLLFFATAPFLLVFAALLFPVTGAVVQVGVALLVFIGGEAVRRHAHDRPALQYLLSTQFAFEAYYREHPPRPFAYYVGYPLLFPYWLVAKQARREFLLYKGYTLASFALLLATSGLQYARAFPPELGWRDFAPLAAASFIAECVVVLMFLMPIVTSVVHFHQQRAPRRLFVLLLAACVSIGFAAARLERRRDPIVSYATRVRVQLRTTANPPRAQAAQVDALRAAWRALHSSPQDIERDGKVQDAPLALAHDVLATFYKLDEAHAFDLWYTKESSKSLLVLYFEAHRGRPPIWRALDQSGAAITDAKQLPQGAFKAMRHAAN